MKQTFSFPKLPSLTERDEVEVEPDVYTMMRGLHDMREFLMHIEDYDLIKVLGDTTKGGVGELSQVIDKVVPYYYDEANTEKYTRLLGKLENLTKEWIVKQGPYATGQTDRYVTTYFQRTQVYPHAVMLYAMAVAALGGHGIALAHYVLDYFLLYRIDPESIPELPWVRSHIASYERYGYSPKEASL
jgi:hypothetical protein